MSRRREKIDNHGRGEQIPGLFEDDPPGMHRECLLAIRAAIEGEKTISEIGKDLGRSQQTVATCTRWWETGGCALK